MLKIQFYLWHGEKYVQYCIKTFNDNDIVFFECFLIVLSFENDWSFSLTISQIVLEKGISQPKQMKAFKHIFISSIDFEMLASF